MCFGPQVKTDFFKDTPKLKWVHSLGTGTDGITDSPYLGKDVIVTATRGIHGVPMSEMAFLMMLAFNRDLRRIERQRGEQKWERYPGMTLDGKTVGILGLGAIAEDMAPRFKAFGMRVVGISRTKRAIPGFDKIYSRAEIVEAVKELDYFVLLVPLEDDTRNIVERRGARRDEADRVPDQSGARRRARRGRAAARAWRRSRSPAPRSTRSPPSRCRRTIRCGRCRTSTSRRTSAAYCDTYVRDASMQFEESLAAFPGGPVRQDGQSRQVGPRRDLIRRTRSCATTGYSTAQVRHL